MAVMSHTNGDYGVQAAVAAGVDSLELSLIHILFIPAGVGLLTAWGILKPVCVPIILITVITTVVAVSYTHLDVYKRQQWSRRIYRLWQPL